MFVRLRLFLCAPCAECLRTQSSQSEHPIKIPFFRVSDDVSGIAGDLWALELWPSEVRLTQQAENTQLPVDLRREEDLSAFGAVFQVLERIRKKQPPWASSLTLIWVLNRMCLKAWILHKMASIRIMTGSYSMYLSTGFVQDFWRKKKKITARAWVE